MDWTTFGARTIETQKGKFEIRFSPQNVMNRCTYVQMLESFNILNGCRCHWKKVKASKLSMLNINRYLHKMYLERVQKGVQIKFWNRSYRGGLSDFVIVLCYSCLFFFSRFKNNQRKFIFITKSTSSIYNISMFCSFFIFIQINH